MRLSASIPHRVSVLKHIVDWGWLTGDIIAGLTVGMVVVPQGMSYAVVSAHSSSDEQRDAHGMADCWPYSRIRFVLSFRRCPDLLCEL